jgi:hypothetical protein
VEKDKEKLSVINLRDELVSIYRHIREKYQAEIDNVFDSVSRQIGFIVTTTLPVVLEVGEGGKIKSFSMGAGHLKDTLFERELSAALKPLLDDPLPLRSIGTYKLNLLWFGALKLKLRTCQMELYPHPAEFAHYPGEFVKSTKSDTAGKFISLKNYEWCEPAHWFDSGVLIAAEEAVLIDAIDEVYPELKLLDHIASSREAHRKVRPEVHEPAHFQHTESSLESEKIKNALSELASVLRRYGY